MWLRVFRIMETKSFAGFTPRSAPQTTVTAIIEYNLLMLVIRVISISAISYIGFSQQMNCSPTAALRH